LLWESGDYTVFTAGIFAFDGVFEGWLQRFSFATSLRYAGCLGGIEAA